MSPEPLPLVLGLSALQVTKQRPPPFSDTWPVLCGGGHCPLRVPPPGPPARSPSLSLPASERPAPSTHAPSGDGAPRHAAAPGRRSITAARPAAGSRPQLSPARGRLHEARRPTRRSPVRLSLHPSATYPSDSPKRRLRTVALTSIRLFLGCGAPLGRVPRKQGGAGLSVTWWSRPAQVRSLQAPALPFTHE